MKIASAIALPVAIGLFVFSAAHPAQADNSSHAVTYTPSAVTLQDNVIGISGFIMASGRNEFALTLARAVTQVSEDRPIVLRLDVSGIFGNGAEDMVGLLKQYHRAGRRFQVVVDGQCVGRCADILQFFEADILKGE